MTIENLTVVRVDRNDERDARIPEREIIARVLYKRHHGGGPDWPIGVDRLGYNQEPYVKHVPAWEWFHGGDADAILEAIESEAP